MTVVHHAIFAEKGLLLRQSLYILVNIFSNYYPTIAPFYHIRAKERAKYATLLHCRTGQKYGLNAERQNGRTKLYFLVE